MYTASNRPQVQYAQQFLRAEQTRRWQQQQQQAIAIIDIKTKIATTMTQISVAGKSTKRPDLQVQKQIGTQHTQTKVTTTLSFMQQIIVIKQRYAGHCVHFNISN